MLNNALHAVLLSSIVVVPVGAQIGSVEGIKTDFEANKRPTPAEFNRNFEILQKAISELALQGATALPPTAVVAFNGPCPKDWDPFIPAIGRTVVGAGPSSSSTSSRTLGESGGVEVYQLKLEEMPRHKHETAEAGDNTNSPWGAASEGRGRHGNTLTWTPNFTGRSYTAPEGGNIPHENMPPFTVLNYCVKK